MGVDALMILCPPSRLDDAALAQLNADLIVSSFENLFDDRDPEEQIVRRLDDWDEPPDIEDDPRKFLFVDLFCTRYYAEGYRRGPIQEIVRLADWLESRVPWSRVYYGSDRDFKFELFDPVRRADLLADRAAYPDVSR